MAIDTFSFVDGERDEMRLLVGIQGPTGAGKTLSSLRIALGIQQYQAEKHGEAGPIVLIDTNNGQAKAYLPAPGAKASPPNTFAVKYLDLPPPYAPPRYRDALEAAAILAPSVIIIDGASQEWTGKGGMQDAHEGQLKKYSGNSFAAWNGIKRLHNDMMGVLMTQQVPVIVTFRSKEKSGLEGSRVVDLGWRAIAETEFPYEMKFGFLVGREQPGHLSFDREYSDQLKMDINAEGVVQEGELATEEVGRRLMAWALGEELKEKETT